MMHPYDAGAIAQPFIHRDQFTVGTESVLSDGVGKVDFDDDHDQTIATVQVLKSEAGHWQLHIDRHGLTEDDTPIIIQLSR